MSDRNGAQHALLQVHSGVGHSATETQRAESTAFAGRDHEQRVAGASADEMQAT